LVTKGDKKINQVMIDASFIFKKKKKIKIGADEWV